MNKIFFLEGKQGEVLGILKSAENMSYLDFVNICDELAEEYESKDLYIIKEGLITKYGFDDVTVAGGYEVTKRKGLF